MTKATKLLTVLLQLLMLLSCGKQPLPRSTQLLERHAAALGGLDRLGAVHSRHIEADLVQPGGKKLGALSTFSKDGSRLVTALHLGAASTTVVYDGSKGYTRTAKGVDPLTPKAAERAMISSSIDIVEACRIAPASCKPEVIGLRNIAGRRCYLVKLRWTHSGEVSAYLDVNDYRLVRTVTSVDSAQGPIEVSTFFRDFRACRGLMLPQSQSVAGKYGEYLVQVRSYDINPDLPDSLFESSLSNPLLSAKVTP